MSTNTTPEISAGSCRIDGSKVRFWALKKEAVAAAKAIGWQASDVWRVHTRFAFGYAIHQPVIGEFMSRERYAELYEARQ